MAEWYNDNRLLSTSERRHNGVNVYNYFVGLGWTLNAACALLGNMELESSINPGLWQIGFKPESKNAGYGLVQWTPWTKYANWAGASWRGNGDLECNRLEYEWRNEKQWIQNVKMSFDKWAHSNDEVERLTEIFMKNYERPGVPHLQDRIDYALAWYIYLTGDERPPEPDEKPVSPFLGIDTWLKLWMLKKKKKEYKHVYKL